jgi:uncharacterized phage protein (TIGR01671 family)
MKRNIKFRGKSIETNEWVYGNLVVDSMTGNKMSIIIWADMSEENKSGGAYVWVDIVIGTESQFTGLKDTNNKEIYEGDLISRELSQGADKIAVKIVLFKEGCFRACNSKGSSSTNINVLFPKKVYGMNAKVIGNIWDNPELLEYQKSPIVNKH